MAGLGIQAIIFDLGNFKTPILNEGRLKWSLRSLDDYDQVMDRFHGVIDYLVNHCPGDPKKAVKAMVDVIKGEGFAAEKALPERLVLGTDMLGYIQNKCEETLTTCREWAALIHSTNFDGPAPQEQSQADVVSLKLAQ